MNRYVMMLYFCLESLQMQFNHDTIFISCYLFYWLCKLHFIHKRLSRYIYTSSSGREGDVNKSINALMKEFFQPTFPAKHYISYFIH